MMTTQLLAIIAILLLVNGGAAFHPSQSQQTQRQPQTSARDGAFCLNAVVSRRDCISLSLTTIIATTILTPRPVLASDDDDAVNAKVALNYNGVYTDPNHAKGYRILIGNTESATLQLQDDPNSGNVYNLPVQVKASNGIVQNFSFDFSAKGGPSNIVGVFAKDREGIPIITFPDGNSWKKRETGPIGVYYDDDGMNPKKLYVIRQLKGPELTVDVIDGKNGVVTSTIKAKAGNPTITFEFPGGSISGVFSLKKKTISFEDGNVWTKF